MAVEDGGGWLGGGKIGDEIKWLDSRSLKDQTTQVSSAWSLLELASERTSSRRNKAAKGCNSMFPRDLSICVDEACSVL